MKILILILKGVAIGIAMLVPGVSGGTMAIILGVYDDLIHSVSSFKDIKKTLFSFLYCYRWYYRSIGIFKINRVCS